MSETDDIAGAQTGLEATVPVASDPAVEATVPVAGTGPASGISPATPITIDSAPPHATTDDLCGRTLQHFKVLDRIGAGGMGSVYAAHDLSLDRPVALKVISSEIMQDPTQQERFIREARSQARLSHPNVVPIYYIGEQDGLLFFAMEHVQGEALSALLDRGERLEWPRALEILIDVARALKLAHAQGIVHRDIKPSNLLLSGDGVIKVADFGLAKRVSSEMNPQLTQQGAVIGSPLYMSPEQGQGEEVDHRSDIYSLGASFYHLLAGRPPFESKTPVGVIAKHLSQPPPLVRQTLPHVPEALEYILQRMLAKDPAERFGDYDELIGALVQARPESTTPAGFWVRGMALVVDLVLFSIVSIFVGPVAYAALFVYTVGGWWWRGKTLGKWIFKIRIRTLTNEPVSLRRAVLRHLAQFWGPLVLGAAMGVNRLVFGVWEISAAGPVFAKARWLAVLLVILAVGVTIAWIVGMVWAGFRQHKRSWHDLACGTQVVYHLPEPQAPVPPPR